MGKASIWTISCFSPFPFLTMLRINEQNVCQAILSVRYILLSKSGKLKKKLLKFP